MIYLLKRNSLCIPLLCFILFAVRKRCFWSRYGDMLSARGGPQWRTHVIYDEIIGTFVLHISGHFLFFYILSSFSISSIFSVFIVYFLVERNFNHRRAKIKISKLMLSPLFLFVKDFKRKGVPYVKRIKNQLCRR